MIISCAPKCINPIYRCGGGHISLKVHEQINIGGVVALVFLAMVGVDFA